MDGKAQVSDIGPLTRLLLQSRLKQQTVLHGESRFDAFGFVVLRCDSIPSGNMVRWARSSRAPSLAAVSDSSRSNALVAHGPGKCIFSQILQAHRRRSSTLLLLALCCEKIVGNFTRLGNGNRQRSVNSVRGGRGSGSGGGSQSACYLKIGALLSRGAGPWNITLLRAKRPIAFGRSIDGWMDGWCWADVCFASVRSHPPHCGLNFGNLANEQCNRISDTTALTVMNVGNSLHSKLPSHRHFHRLSSI